MATSTQKPKPANRNVPTRPTHVSPGTTQHEVVDPVWLLKAAILTIAAAVACAWLTLCLLLYQGQWQLILHPDTNPKLSSTLPIQKLRFGASETGQPSLSGLWLPASDSNAAVSTILFLPDGSGRLADNMSALEQLHQLPLNIFAFDYRGFGASDPTPHPTQARMAEDAESALNFLVNTRHLPAASIIPYGAGLGAALAVNLCAAHPDLPALIVEAPVPDTYRIARTDPRARLVPLHLFFHERFNIVTPLRELRIPKLLLTHGPSSVALAADSHDVEGLFQLAADPKFTAYLLPWNADTTGPAAYREAILRFMNEYFRSRSVNLQPKSAHPQATPSPVQQGSQP